MKKKPILLSIPLLLLVLLLFWGGPLLTQEDNTLSVLSGIMRLSFSDDEFVKYDEDPDLLYYVSEADADETLLKDLPPLEGYVLTDQMGSGYMFTQESEPENTIIVSGTQFSRFYRLWKIPGD